MTYAAVGLGEDVIACKGQLYGQGLKGPDVKGKYCCDADDWSNSLYSSIKGADSLRYHNEKRVRHALNLLLEQGALEQFASSKAIAIQPGFLAALKASATNYRSKFPKSRWVKKDVGVYHPNCGTYSTWGDPSPPSAQQKAVINAVPRGGGYSIVTDMPDVSQLLVVSNGQVAPGGWLQSFVDAFKPKTSRVKVTRQPSKTSNTSIIKHVSPDVFQQGGAQGQQGSTQGLSTGQKVAVVAGVGVAALAAVAYGRKSGWL